ncbi:hypothetical protein LMG7053_03356 [Achromobacter ruhlandii]|uniref:Uncharacterized protein n=1 Tax=Achromobacter ruhlandii TaxID=72557 RepID=A0ABM8LWI2_9BURK|nr:hypothetical protein Axylo_4368 [Achromobacter xylosoxidans]CAB3951097.1 hypothetical protein LMG7053_03356 [Achromobacter ruhlandii]
MKKGPHAAPSACCPRGGFFILRRLGDEKEPPRRAFGLLPPEGAFFILRRLGDEKGPPRRAFGLLPPEGAFFILRRLGDEKGPAMGGPLTRAVRAYSVFSSGCDAPERVFHRENSTPPPIRPKVTDSDTTAGILPMKPTRKIFVPMNTSTSDSAYFR